MCIREEWLPVVGYEDSYEVSNRGRVRSIDRWRNARHGPVLRRGKVLKANWVGPPRRRYAQVRLYRDGRQRGHLVHLLMLTAFIGERPEGEQGLHRDDNPAHNVIDNLYWGTPQQNWDDLRRNAGYHPCGDCGALIHPRRRHCARCAAPHQRQAERRPREEMMHPFDLVDSRNNLPTLTRETLAAALATARSRAWQDVPWKIYDSEGIVVRTWGD